MARETRRPEAMGLTSVPQMGMSGVGGGGLPSSLCLRGGQSALLSPSPKAQYLDLLLHHEWKNHYLKMTSLCRNASEWLQSRAPGKQWEERARRSECANHWQRQHPAPSRSSGQPWTSLDCGPPISMMRGWTWRMLGAFHIVRIQDPVTVEVKS